MAIQKHGSAQWSGGLKDGRGNVSTESGALKQQPYGFKTRFEGIAGTNPEELIGAAHAACFTMALSKMLEEAGSPAESLETLAKVSLDKVGEGFEITAIALTLGGRVPGAGFGRGEVQANRRAGQGRLPGLEGTQGGADHPFGGVRLAAGTLGARPAGALRRNVSLESRERAASVKQVFIDS